ncbi:uncharacterized protein LOC123538252 [Mercenaria mercenaria]|uniref:uncharacterized protein LOC123538252 n=1 Tax=Mercenaria mercenaria TaxID=6596 RepID=UPI00234F1E96|nr:uncharacterized protein LOC123538252 [Mercenaria mercenaria]
MHNAYKCIKDENVSVCRAAKIFGVPEQTLRDRIHGKIDPDCVTTGRAPVLSLYEESKIVDHLKTMAGYGYGYTKQETVDIATDYAIRLSKRTKSNPLTLAWFEGFRNRWPDVKVHKPRSLEQLRAKMANEKNVNTYFDNLRGTLDQYDLHDKPHLIFNIDEKGISLDHKPPHIVHVHANPPAVTTGKSKTVTVFGCGSASGVAIPPYFVFAGKRMNPDLLAGKCAGADGTVSETGWSNGAIFRHWIEHHFIKYIPGRTNEPVLLMLDGHKSHVSVGFAEWALEQNIVIFVLPAHCSHILQPFDVACFGPFQKIYNIQCHKLIRETSATICRYNVCELACKAYTKAVSPENLQSGFRKTGIYPLDKAAIPQDKLLPADVYQESAECSQASEASTVEGGIEVNKDEGCSVFMKEKEKELKRKKSETEKQRKTRKTMSKIVSGKEMSTESVIEQMKEHELSQKKRKPEQMQTKEKSV